jgi:hypothetical protein
VEGKFRSQFAQVGAGDRAGAAGAGATRGHPLDQHRERQIAAVADDQPWDGGLGPFQYWAVPVLPKTPGREADPDGLAGALG